MNKKEKDFSVDDQKLNQTREKMVVMLSELLSEDQEMNTDMK